jgi:hypothetical protein
MNQPIIQQIFFWLQFSSLVLVHLLLISLIIAVINITFSLLKLSRKAQDAVEEIKEQGVDLIQTSKNTAFDISDLISAVLDFVGYKRKTRWFDILFSFIKK